MQVTVKLFATFRSGRFDQAPLDIAPGTTVGKIAEDLGIALPEIGVLLVSGRHAALDHVPAEGATVSIFPLLGGG